MNQTTHSKSARAALLALIAMILSCSVAGASSAAPAIEGVWSFNGGAVDVQAQPGGVFRGVVTLPTKFSQCSHPIGDDMWTEISLQPDGSYFGMHQWYFEETCVPNPTPGPTAWRVLQSATGARFLRVCFSAPGSGDQPAIAAGGSSTDVTYGCIDSAAITTLPKVASHQGTAGQISFRRTVGLPDARKCVRRGSLKIVLHDPAYDPLKRVVVRVKGRKVVDVHNLAKLKRPIILRHLPGGSFKIAVLATTVLDQHLSGSRSYHNCKSRRSSKIELRRNKPRRVPRSHRK